MQEYDIDIMKRNISSLMDEHNVSQTTLALDIGIAQSRISRILNGKDSFTIPQLVKIAKRFHVSVDDLLGLEPEEVEHEATLKDVYKALFDLNKIINLDIINTPVYESDGIPFAEPEYVPAIYLKNEHIEKTLYQWKSLKETNLDRETKQDILQLWENSIISSKKYRPKKWDFKTEEEYSYYLATLILKNANEEPINTEIAELIQKNSSYITKKMGTFDYLSVCASIETALEELPFD